MSVVPRNQPSVRSVSSALLSTALGLTSLDAGAADLAATAQASSPRGMIWMIGALAITLTVVCVAVLRMRVTVSKPSLANLPQLNGLDASSFKQLVADVYRRRGYDVRDAGDAGADADLVLTRGQQHLLVLCRHWQSDRVGMRPVRALYGAMAAHSAQSGVVITAGTFVADAFRFAGLGHIELIDHGSLPGFLKPEAASNAQVSAPKTRLQVGAA